MGINDPAPAISGYGAARAPRPTGSADLVSDDLHTSVAGSRDIGGRNDRGEKCSLREAVIGLA